MKIIDWVRKLIKRDSSDYLLEEVNSKTVRQAFIDKLAITNLKKGKTREDILRNLSKEVFFKEDPVTKTNERRKGKRDFDETYINEKYDRNNILSEEDLVSLVYLYYAVKDGNTIERGNNFLRNFLTKNPNNIIIAINLMIEEGKREYKNLKDEVDIPMTAKDLIPDTYDYICELIEDYEREGKEAEK